MNKFQQYFWKINKKCLIHKWHHYFEIYETYASKFQGTSPKILEVGLWKGGSLEMWNYYFDSECTIYGVDIDKNCKKLPQVLNAINIIVDIGDQSNRQFWYDYFSNIDFNFDIIVDDGGHLMDQQINTFECCFKHLSKGGVYICEDTHTSYMHEYGGDLNKNTTFMNYIKNYLDKIHSNHFNYQLKNKYPVNDIESIHFHESITVIKKSTNDGLKSIATIR
jgi:hypothetical protein